MDYFLFFLLFLLVSIKSSIPSKSSIFVTSTPPFLSFSLLLETFFAGVAHLDALAPF